MPAIPERCPGILARYEGKEEMLNGAQPDG
jgi:hypothetical protein